jgi:phosphoribosylamine-glycine ligase
LSVVGRGADLVAAREAATAAADLIQAAGMQRRRDIALEPASVGVGASR